MSLARGACTDLYLAIMSARGRLILLVSYITSLAHLPLKISNLLLELVNYFVLLLNLVLLVLAKLLIVVHILLKEAYMVF